MQRCAVERRCHAYIYASTHGRCYLKSFEAALFGTPTVADKAIQMGRCVKRTPEARETAVCLSGMPHSLWRTAPSVREHVLDAWDADAFLVAQLGGAEQRSTRSDSRAAAAALGPRLRLAVHRTSRQLLDPELYGRVLEWNGSRVRRGPNVGGSAGYKGWILQLLNRESCLRVVLHSEAASGVRYRVYARLRLDSLFLAPLPRSMLEASPNVAIVPAGDAWGQSPQGLCDRMLVGGFREFEADARLWVTFRDNPEGIIEPGYITESATRAHFLLHGINVRALPIAYCTINTEGACRYPEHLSISVSLLGPELLREHPELCLCNDTLWCNLLIPRPCSLTHTKWCNVQSTWCSDTHFVQTDATKLSDPAFCKLTNACRAAHHLASSPPSPPAWLRLQHEDGEDREQRHPDQQGWLRERGIPGYRRPRARARVRAPSLLGTRRKRIPAR
jgi:hypothetical protein